MDTTTPVNAGTHLSANDVEEEQIIEIRKKVPAKARKCMKQADYLFSIPDFDTLTDTTSEQTDHQKCIGLKQLLDCGLLDEKDLTEDERQLLSHHDTPVLPREVPVKL